MAKVTLVETDRSIEYDFERGTVVEIDSRTGNIIGEARPVTEEEHEQLNPEYLKSQVGSLNDVVNQLILDALMGF